MIGLEEKYAGRIAALFLFVLNLAVGFLFLNEGLFHFDSIELARAVEKTYQTGVLQPAVAGRYGSVIVNALIYFPFYLAGQNADLAIRVSGALFHALSIVAFFLFIRELFADRVQALFGALLFSFFPYYFISNTTGKEHGMSVFFQLMAFYLLCRGMNRKNVFLAGMAALSFSVAISVRESILITAPLYFLLLLRPWLPAGKEELTCDRGSRNAAMLWWGLVPVCVAVAWMSYAFLGELIHRVLFVRATHVNAFLGIASRKLPQALQDLSSVASLIFYVLALAGIYVLARRRQRFLVVFFALWTASLFYFGNSTGYQPRHLDQPVMALCVLASYVLARWYADYKVMVSAAVVYCVASMFLFMYPMLEFRHHYNGEKRFAFFVQSLTEKNAVILTADDHLFIEYYGHRKTLPMPAGRLKDLLDDYLSRVRQLMADRVPVYYTENSYGVTPYIFRQAVQRGFAISLVGTGMIENFHGAERELDVYEQRLYKFTLSDSGDRGREDGQGHK